MKKTTTYKIFYYNHGLYQIILDKLPQGDVALQNYVLEPYEESFPYHR